MKQRVKQIVKVTALSMLLCLSSVAIYAAPDMIDYHPKYLEEKLVNDIQNVLDRLLGKNRYVATVQVTVEQNGKEKVNRTITPIVEEGTKKIEVVDAEVDSSMGFPEFLSPSLIGIGASGERLEEKEASYDKPVSYKENVEIDQTAKYKIKHILYTIIINEKEKEVPGYEESQVVNLLKAVLKLDAKRGDKIDIVYSSFSDDILSFADMAFQAEVLLKKIKAPLWLLHAGMILIGMVAIYGLIFVIYRKIMKIVIRREEHREKLVMMQMKHKLGKEKDGMDYSEVVEIANSHPEHFATVIKDWVEE